MRDRMSGLDSLDALIGSSAVMQQVRTQIERFARSPVPILILGETGTGKELCAAAIAQLSGRHPFVPVNCATFPDGLAESELFGHERGAFTGAVRVHIGVVALADGGVLFLDELGELPPAMQARSEEHTSELQSRGHLVCRLLLEKKKKNEMKNT